MALKDWKRFRKNNNTVEYYNKKKGGIMVMINRETYLDVSSNKWSVDIGNYRKWKTLGTFKSYKLAFKKAKSYMRKH